MSHWNFGGGKPGQTVVVVIYGAVDGDDVQPMGAVYAIAVQAGSEAEHDEIAVGDGDDYTYIDVEQCAKA